MSRLTLLHYKVDDEIAVTKLPMPDEQQKRILDALKVSLPANSLSDGPLAVRRYFGANVLMVSRLQLVSGNGLLSTIYFSGR